MSILGTLQLGSQQARHLGVKPRVQQSPYLELCCLSQCAKGSYQQAEQAVERLTGVRVSAKTQQRIVQRNPMSAPQPPASVSQLALDGGRVRLVTPKGQASEWR